MKIITTYHNNIGGILEYIVLSNYDVEDKATLINNIRSGQEYRILTSNGPIVKVVKNSFVRIDTVQSMCDDLEWLPRDDVDSGFGKYTHAP